MYNFIVLCFVVGWMLVFVGAVHNVDFSENTKEVLPNYTRQKQS